MLEEEEFLVSVFLKDRRISVCIFMGQERNSKK